MTSSFVDPYTYPGSPVLRNLLDEQDRVRLLAAEYEMTFYRRRELLEHPVEGQFDLDHLREIHRRLYQDIWSWAGQLRTVEIAKGSSKFHPSSLVEPAFASVHEWLIEGTSLLSDADINRHGVAGHTINDRDFVANAADLLEKVNYLHPFREGNGRAQRVYLDQIASRSGRGLSWCNVDRIENELASVRAFDLAAGEPFRPLLAAVLKPPHGGPSLLDGAP